MLNGWSTRTAEDLDPTIRTWAEIFGKYEIPSSAYAELYQRAFDQRQLRMRDGKEVPQMDATLLVSQWTGNWGLQADLRQREVARGRTLTTNAESVCELCLGSGWEQTVRDGYAGVRRCTHGMGEQAA